MDLQFWTNIATIISVIIAGISLWYQGKSTDKKVENLTDIVNLQNQYFSKGAQNIKANHVTVYNTPEIPKKKRKRGGKK